MTENRQETSEPELAKPDAMRASVDRRERLRVEMAKTFSGVGDLATFARAQRTAEGVRVAPVLRITEVRASIARVEVSAVQTVIGQTVPAWRSGALSDGNDEVETSVSVSRNEEARSKAQAAAPLGRSPRKRFSVDVRLAAWSVLAVVAMSVGAVTYMRASDRERAHDARIESPIVNVSARLSAIVRAIYVSDGQRVEAGDLIAELEGTDTAEAELEDATRRLSSTKVYAQVAGVVGSININVGDYVAAGHRIVSLFQRDDVWVTANFRETQLPRLRPGQHAWVYVPALDETLHGVVDSVVGTVGAASSPTPAGSDTDDRLVPVRIRFSPRQPALQRLLVGMSAGSIVTVP